MAPGPWQIIIIVLVILLLFGAGKLPRIMEDMAKGIKSFKKGLKEDDSSDSSGNDKTVQSISDQNSAKDDDVIDAKAETVSDDADKKTKAKK